MNRSKTDFTKNKSMEHLMAHGRQLHDRAVFESAWGLVSRILRFFKTTAAFHETGNLQGVKP